LAMFSCSELGDDRPFGGSLQDHRNRHHVGKSSQGGQLSVRASQGAGSFVRLTDPAGYTLG
jgi:hypothetical protein